MAMNTFQAELRDLVIDCLRRRGVPANAIAVGVEHLPEACGMPAEPYSLVRFENGRIAHQVFAYQDGAELIIDGDDEIRFEREDFGHLDDLRDEFTCQLGAVLRRGRSV